MASNDSEATITLNPPAVVFKGMWVRRDIDTATRLMLRELPKHFMQMRKEIEDATRREQEHPSQRKGKRAKASSSK